VAFVVFVAVVADVGVVTDHFAVVDKFAKYFQLRFVNSKVSQKTF
jgi:hypothetical protein